MVRRGIRISNGKRRSEKGRSGWCKAISIDKYVVRVTTGLFFSRGGKREKAREKLREMEWEAERGMTNRTNQRFRSGQVRAALVTTVTRLGLKVKRRR